MLVVFNRDPRDVAIDLLGMVLVRELGDRTLKAKIVETEAYYGPDDPASRARNGKKRYNAPMFDGAGRLFVYNVHKYWMLNFTTRPVSAVLVRAAEPLNFEANTQGPGRLSMELKIGKELSGKELGKESGVWVEPGEKPERIAASYRIGVSSDLPEPLRFFDLDSRWVSASRRFVKEIRI